jgi:hypothetical protein
MKLTKFNYGLILLLILTIITKCQTDNSTVKNLTVLTDDEDDDDDLDTTNTNNTQIYNNTIISPVEVVENLPEAHIILPIRRRDTSKSALNMAPCGGVRKQKSHTLTNKGSNLDVIWEVITPIAQGNCTVKISPGLEKEDNFTVLYPIDIKTSANGEFPCGRRKDFESHQFNLPDDYVCDACTVQWAWITPVGNLYQCSDIIINGNKIEDCLAMCKNGGSCFNGKCLCVNGFYGDYCENTSSMIFFIIYRNFEFFMGMDYFSHYTFSYYRRCCLLFHD